MFHKMEAMGRCQLLEGKGWTVARLLLHGTRGGRQRLASLAEGGRRERQVGPVQGVQAELEKKKNQLGN
jgi:hypothetical protein